MCVCYSVSACPYGEYVCVYGGILFIFFNACADNSCVVSLSVVAQHLHQLQ